MMNACPAGEAPSRFSRRSSRRIDALLLAFGVSVLAACGGGGGGLVPAAPPPAPPGPAVVQSAPAIGTQPVAATVTEGATAQFTVTATGTPTPALQWQGSSDGGTTWTDLAGRTGGTLDLVAVAAADNGRRFRAVASNAAGTATSNSALLTVTTLPAFPALARAFSAVDTASGTEFWMTDGTAAGTVMVKDINPGAAGSSPASITRFGRFMIFSASDGTNGAELWRSDGTAAGTVMVADLRPGASGSFPGRFKECNGSLFFEANGGTGDALWKTDGITAVKVADITVMNTTRPMACLNNVLVLGAFDAANGMELWRSDGTTAGTTLVKDIVPGAGDSDPRELVLFQGKVFFSTGADGLWSSDGTPAGTVQVATGMGEPTWLTVNGSTLYFSGVNAAFGSEPWKSDGTTVGTAPIEDLNTDPSPIFPGRTLSSFPYKFTVSGGVTYFGAEPVTNSQQLWRTDGTAAGTFALTSLSPGRVATFGDSIRDVNGTLYFLAAGGGLGQELWKTDGTVAGTVLVKDISPGAPDSLPTGFMSIGNVLLFSANDGVANGTELWRSDGTDPGTQLLKDICSPACSGSPQP
jgi:ELWxxDGT repeat protein